MILEKTWLENEAKKIIEKDNIIFASGYGPSGLPHLGTLSENVRVDLLRKYLEVRYNKKSSLLCFSDDMDGLRKSPTNIPKNLDEYLSYPLSCIPDPYGLYSSFAENNNNRLRYFLNNFDIKHQFISATTMYQSGVMNDMMMLVLENFNKILDVIIPTLGEDRQKTYSPILPIHPVTKKIVQAKILEIKNDLIVWSDGIDKYETSVLNGDAKFQWKMDWPARWIAYNIDYEMCSKDLTDSVIIGRKICQVLNKTPPVLMINEMFLDENMKKISKSKGNGVDLEDMLKYCTKNSIKYFLSQNPQKTKVLSMYNLGKINENYYLSKNEVTDFIDLYKMKININDVLVFIDLYNITSIEEYYVFFKNSKFPDEELLLKLINYHNDYLKNLNKNKEVLITQDHLDVISDLYSVILNENDETMDQVSVQAKIFNVARLYHAGIPDFFKKSYEILMNKSEGPKLGYLFSVLGKEESLRFIDKIKNSNKKNLNY